MKLEEWNRVKFMARTQNIYRHQKDRAKERKIPFEITREDIREVAADAIGKPCRYCQVPVTYLNFSIDHKTPTQRGGTQTKDNIECICDRCNQIKGNMTPDEFMAILNTAKTQLEPVAYAHLLARLRAGGRFIYN